MAALSVVWAEPFWKSYSGERILMRNDCSAPHWVICSVAMPLILFAGFATAQAASPSQTTPTNAPVATEKDFAATQEQLIKLLRLSPTLTTVVARDPSLLSNQEYVSRNNPQLAQFLESHPEIARNPDFYLFTKLHDDGRPDQALERKVWPELSEPPHEPPLLESFSNDLGPFLVFLCLLGALLWLIRLFLENRRWGRIFTLQTDVHGKLIDKFGTNQELLAYMGTEAGKRFLEAAPIPVDFEREQRVPSAVARVLTPLQIGIVLTLLGIGLLLLRHALKPIAAPLLVLGTVALMPGLGFIISAGITWVLAGRLGLIPESTAGTNRVDADFNAEERQ
jgi:hypothetical protein